MRVDFKISSAFLLLSLFLLDCQGRSISDWSITKDASVINECLSRSIRRINRELKLASTVGDATNVVLKTQVNNGLNFILIFDLSNQRWQCTLYKSMVQILDIKLEQCSQMAKEEDGERKVDQGNQAANSKHEDNLGLGGDPRDLNENMNNNKQVETNDNQPLPPPPKVDADLPLNNQAAKDDEQENIAEQNNNNDNNEEKGDQE